MEDEKVSVIVPVYNVEKYLPRCLDSILNQTYQNLEIILVDDGSPDNCGAICDKYAKKDQRIQVIHQENRGVSAARNSGIEWSLSNSNSQYLTFIDSDDWVHPQFIEILVNSICSTGAQASMVGNIYTDTYSDCFEKYNSPAQPEIHNGEELFLIRTSDFNYPWGKLYRKVDFKTLRYPVGKIFEDVFTTYQVLFSVERIALMDIGLYFYFHNTEGISHSPWNPKELIVFEGMRQQLAFYAEHGYDQAYQKEYWLYLNHFAYQITRIRENKADLAQNKVHIKNLRAEMLRIIRQSAGKYNFSNMPQCYAAAYPKLSECHRLLKASIRTVKSEGFYGFVNKIFEVIKR